MKKWFAVMLFGITLMLFTVACAVLALGAGDNTFAYLFMAFAPISFIVSAIGLVMIFRDDKKENADKTAQNIDSEKEDKE